MFNFFMVQGNMQSNSMPDGSRRKSKSLINATDPDHTTVPSVMRSSFSTHATKNCMGTRKFLGMHKLDGARFPIKKFGETSWQTYGEIGENTKAVGSGLRSLGMLPLTSENSSPEAFQKVTGPHTVLIYEDTSADWMTMMLGALSQSLVVATSYSTLGIDSVVDAIKECNVNTILCNYKDVEKVKKITKDCPSLKNVIYSTNLVAPEDMPSDEAGGACPITNLHVMSMKALIELGKEFPSDGVDPTPEAMAVVMYTSGSTGKPKGVMITHQNIVASLAGLTSTMIEAGCIKGQETYLAYLPAAHILELCAELANLSYGTALGFSDPKSISSNGACRLTPSGELHTKPGYPYPPGGIQEFKPTFFAAVPKIWDILKKGVEANIGGSAVKSWLFNVAFAARSHAVVQGRDTPLFNAILFSKLRAMLGGRMRLAVTGGGPCNSEVQSFIRTAFMMPLVQGYALTETTCAGTIQKSSDPRDGVVGPPLSCLDILLRSTPEVTDRSSKPYLDSDTSHYDEPCLGRGEVLIRGQNVSAGYFKLPEKTAAEFDKDGWFHTGDVGVWTKDGCLKIVDRLKNLIKLLGGEYIAVEAMEAAFNSSVYANGLNGGVLVYGDGEMDRAVALVQVNAAALKNWAKANDVDATDLEKLCKDPKATKAVLDDLNANGKVAKLGANEKIVAVHLVSGLGSPEKPEDNSPWTPENAFLTASNKLNRKVVERSLDHILQPLRIKAIR